MGADNSAVDLLAHFDGPKLGEFERRVPTRGMRWLLRRISALAVLLLASMLLTQFGYSLAAELALARAARAGAFEATLPRATAQSVAQSVKRCLQHYPKRFCANMQLSVQQNGMPVRGLIRASGGDQIRVTLAVPAYDVLPLWLGKVSFWRTVSKIEARAERTKPGRELPRYHIAAE